MSSAQQPNLAAIAAFFLIGGFAFPVKAQFFPEHPTFFDEGNRQLEREIQTLQESSPSNSVLTINSDSLQWQKFVFSEGNCSIWIPTGSTGYIPEKGREIPTSMGILKFVGLYARQSKSHFRVGYSLSESFLSTASTHDLFLQIRDYFSRKMLQSPEGEAEITFADYPGREFIWLKDRETVTVHAYKIGDRIYLIEATLKDEDNLERVRQTFFDSFELL